MPSSERSGSEGCHVRSNRFRRGTAAEATEAIDPNTARLHFGVINPEAIMVVTEEDITADRLQRHQIQHHRCLQECKENNALQWRMFVCGLAIAMLWSTTLSLAQTIVKTTTTTPSFSSVLDTCEFAYQEMVAQKRWYEECARHELSTCELAREHSLQQSLDQMAEKQEKNQQIFEEIKYFQATCDASVGDLFHTMQTFTAQVTPPNQIIYQDQCPETTRSRLRSRIGDRTATASGAISHATDYVQGSEATLQTVANYASDLHTYNAEYLTNKTTFVRNTLAQHITTLSEIHLASIASTVDTLRSAVTELVLCVGLNPNSTRESCKAIGFVDSALEIYSHRVNVMVYNKRYVLSVFDYIQDTVDVYSDTAQAIIQSARDLYNSVSGAAGAMTWVQNNLVRLYSGSLNLCNVGSANPNWCSFSSSTWFLHAPVLPDVPYIVEMHTPQGFWDLIKDAVFSRERYSERLMQSVVNKGVVWSEQLLALTTESFLTLDSDYDPPQYQGDTTNSTESAVNEFSKSGSAYLSEMTEYIANLTAALSSSVVNASSSFNIAEAAASQSSSSSEHSFSFQAMNIPSNLDLLKMLERFAHINSLFLWLDLLFRMFQSVRMVRKYWDKSAVSLPVVDMRRGVSSMTMEDEDGYAAMLYNSLTLFGHMWVAAGVLVVVLIMIVFTLAALYIPAYAEYHASCVQNKNVESLLSSNVNAVAFNYANDDGHSILFEGLANYDSVSIDACFAYKSAASSGYELLLKDVVAVATAHEKVAQDAQMVQSCVNLTDMGAVLSQSMNAASPLDFISSPVAMGEPSSVRLPQSCSESMQTDFQSRLVDGFITPAELFNCSAALPLCTVSCTGPSRDMFRAGSKQCSCMSEWFLHASLLNSVAVMGVYVLLNLSRYCFCRAIAIFMWKYLTTGRSFDFKGTFDGNGDVLFPTGDDGEVGVGSVNGGHGGGNGVNSDDGDDGSCNNDKYGDNCTDEFIDLQCIYGDQSGDRGGGEKQTGLPVYTHSYVDMDADTDTLANAVAVKAADTTPISRWDQEEGRKAYQVLLHSRLQQSMRSFYVQGGLFLIVAILVNVPWVLFLLFVNTKMDYWPS